MTETEKEKLRHFLKFVASSFREIANEADELCMNMGMPCVEKRNGDRRNHKHY